MSDADPYKDYAATRTTLRETAKWIVTILGATIVLVIGGGLIAKIADLELTDRLIAAGCLLVLSFACLILLRMAVDIVASNTTPLRDIAWSPGYETTRRIIDGWLAGYYPSRIDTVKKLHDEYARATATVNDATKTQQERQAADTFLVQLQPRIREVIELCTSERLRLKFERLINRTIRLLPLIGAALFIFLISAHKDDATEKQLVKPILLKIAWSAEVEAVLKKAGLDPKCYVPTRPYLLQVSERSGLRAGVLVVPHDLSDDCPAVRVIVTNENKVYPAD